MYRTLWESRVVYAFTCVTENEFGKIEDGVYPYLYSGDLDVDTVEGLIELRESAGEEMDRIFSSKHMKLLSYNYSGVKQTLKEFINE